MSIKKQLLKSKPACKVSFKLTKDQSNNAGKVNLVGNFNNWNETSDEMKPMKDGSFSHALELETGHEYQFRYLVNGTTWINDDEADGYVNSGLGNSENAIISL